MVKLFEEIRKLHSANLFEDLKIVISLVLSKHANSVSKPDSSAVTSFTQQHIYQLHVFYADAWYTSGDYRKAEKHYKEALGLWRGCRSMNDSTERLLNDLTSEIDVRYKLYQVYSALKQTKAAIHVLEALNTKDRTMAINMALGDLYRKEGMDRSAITSYKEVLRNCPLSVEAAKNLMLLGVTRLNIDTLMIHSLQHVNEESWLTEWLNLQQHVIDKNIPASLNSTHQLNCVCPRNVDVMNKRAEIYYRYGQYAQAKIIWQEMLEADPLVLRSVDQMAYVLLNSRDQPGLVKLCAQTSTANQSTPEPWIVNGAFSMITSKFTEAVYFAHKALMIQPNCYTAHVLKGAALSLGVRIAESEQCFKEAIRLEPSRLEAYNESLKAYLRVSKVKDAIVLANTALKQIGSTPTTLYLCGKAFSMGTLQQQMKAKLYLEKSIQGDPSHLLPVYTLTDILSRQGKYKKVIQLLEQSLKNSNTSRLHQLYGDALCETGDRQKAMHHYGTALHLDPTNKKAKEGMEKAEKKSDINTMDDSYVAESLEHSSEIEMHEEGIDSLSWSDPELGF